MALGELSIGWPVLLAFALVFTGFGFYAWTIFWSKSKFARAETILVQRKSRFLSTAERKLFDCLVDALSENYFVFSKVGMTDVLEPNSSARALDIARIDDELQGHYFDFVLCNKVDMSIFGIVELEYSDRNLSRDSNNSKGASRRCKHRDKLVSRACKSSKLKLFYFDVRQDYQNMDITRLITGKSKGSSVRTPTHESQLTVDHSSLSITGQVRHCPKCRSELVTKVSLKGSDIGEKFLMCRKYPYCDYRMSMSDLESMRKLEREESEKGKSKGFSNWSSG